MKLSWVGHNPSGICRFPILAEFEIEFCVLFKCNWSCVRPSIAATATAKSLQLCLTLCDPIDGSPLGSSVPGILQARTLEWVAISFSNAWKWKVKVKSLSWAQLLATPWTAAYQVPPSMGFSRQEYWSGVPLPSPSALHSLMYFKTYFVETPSADFRVLNPPAASKEFSVKTLGVTFTWNPMDCIMPGFPVHHQLPELAQLMSIKSFDAIQPSHPLSSLSPPAFSLSQHQGIFK